MTRARRSYLLVGVCVVMASSTVGCSGEVTELEFGQRGISFERYRDEIQPILQADNVAGATRNCAMQGCHAALVGNLQIIADPDDAQLVENFRQVQTKLDLSEPAASILLTDPLTGPPEHPAKSFLNESDCCYTSILAWIAQEDAPACVCQ